MTIHEWQIAWVLSHIAIGMLFWFICWDAERFMNPDPFRGLENIHKANMKKKPPQS